MTRGYGLTTHDIDWSCPADLEPYAKAHKLEIMENDSIIHAVCGNYVLSAVSVAVEHCLAGKMAKSHYIKEPVMTKTLKGSKEEFTEKDIQMAILTEKKYMMGARQNRLPKTIIKGIDEKCERGDTACQH